jgi:hypothetical protein
VTWALMLLGRQEQVERRVDALFCRQTAARMREACLRGWREAPCGC